MDYLETRNKDCSNPVVSACGKINLKIGSNYKIFYRESIEEDFRFDHHYGIILMLDVFKEINYTRNVNDPGYVSNLTKIVYLSNGKIVKRRFGTGLLNDKSIMGDHERFYFEEVVE